MNRAEIAERVSEFWGNPDATLETERRLLATHHVVFAHFAGRGNQGDEPDLDRIEWFFGRYTHPDNTEPSHMFAGSLDIGPTTVLGLDQVALAVYAPRSAAVGEAAINATEAG